MASCPFGCDDSTPIDVGYTNDYVDPGSSDPDNPGNPGTPGGPSNPAAAVIPDHDSTNTCTAHPKLELDKSVQESTSKCSVYANSCGDGTSSLSKCLSVLEVKAPEIGLYEITLTSDDADWGFFEASECDGFTPLSNSCMLADGSLQSINSYLLNKGSHYFFIGPMSTSGKSFQFTAKMTRSPGWICADYNSAAKYIQVTSDEQVFEDDTNDDGLSILNWSGVDYGKGCTKLGNGGKEKAYIFHLEKKAEVTATLEIESEDQSGTVGMYINSCKDANVKTNEMQTIKCIDGDFSDTQNMTLTVELNAGNYGLIIDSNGPTYKYTLRIKGK